MCGFLIFLTKTFLQGCGRYYSHPPLVPSRNTPGFHTRDASVKVCGLRRKFFGWRLGGKEDTGVELSRNSETHKSAMSSVSFEFMSFGFNSNTLFRLSILNSMAVGKEEGTHRDGNAAWSGSAHG